MVQRLYLAVSRNAQYQGTVTVQFPDRTHKSSKRQDSKNELLRGPDLRGYPLNVKRRASLKFLNTIDPVSGIGVGVRQPKRLPSTGNWRQARPIGIIEQLFIL